PLMVELFIRRAFLLSARAGRWHILPVRPSPGRRLPTPARLNEPSAPGPDPHGRDWRGLPPRTRFASPRPRIARSEVCPCRPSSSPAANPPPGERSHRVECRVLAGPHRSALVPSKPPSSTDKRVSPHPAPRVATVACGPLSALV